MCFKKRQKNITTKNLNVAEQNGVEYVEAIGIIADKEWSRK